MTIFSFLLSNVDEIGMFKPERFETRQGRAQITPRTQTYWQKRGPQRIETVLLKFQQAELEGVNNCAGLLEF